MSIKNYIKWFFINLNLIFLAHIDTIIYSTFNYLSRKKGKDTWSVQFILTALSSIEFHPHFFLLPLSPFLSSKGRKTREREREREKERERHFESVVLIRRMIFIAGRVIRAYTQSSVQSEGGIINVARGVRVYE